ncbi:MAG: hypothetical protein GY731_13105 [Gammaproteobacteria bacterium]|nr:hypothetical protein [Gammaproteobacteria bacterium]
MSVTTPRVVVITRETEYELLLAHHATRGQAEFFLSSRDQSIDELEARHQRFTQALHQVMSVIPTEWRRNRVRRDELDRFLFEPEDLIIAVGQDGLVANAAKYLNGQQVIGVNPDQAFFDGILVPFASNQVGDILTHAIHGNVDTQQRTMVKASMEDGQSLLALNEIYVGHHSHQSARYRIRCQARDEHHSSSGIIVASGTGATGWARSIHRERHDQLVLPEPEDGKLAFYVREAFPSIATGTSLTSGILHGDEQLQVRSEMNNGGVIFGDGIEADYLEFNWGNTVHIETAEHGLNLIRTP